MSLQVIVNGQPINLVIGEFDTVLDVRRRAVSLAGYDEGARWEVRDPCGYLVDQTAWVLDVAGEPDARLFVNVPAGIGA